MKNNILYTREKSLIPFIILLIMGFISLGYLLYLKLTVPEILNANGIFVALIFMIIFDLLIVLLTCFNYTSRKNFLLKRDEILKNGIVVEGKIVDISSNLSTHSHSDNDTTIHYHYFALVTYDNGNELVQYLTPELAFSPHNLTSNKVKVHIYNNEIYVDGFQLGEYKSEYDILENNSNEKDNINKVLHKMTYFFQIIFGLLFIIICVILLLKISNIYGVIVFLSFILCGIAVMLSGILHLLKNNKGNKKDLTIHSLTKKIFLIGSSIFWFGMLIVMDYSFLQEGSTQSFLFSLIFWAVGIYVIFDSWKNS